MMPKTHLAMDIAASLVLCQPKTPEGYVCAIAGGALGGITADIDTVKNDYQNDALTGQLAAVAICVVCIALDMFSGNRVISEIIEHRIRAIAGGLIYLGLLACGFSRPHRTFTHSLLALALFSICIGLVYPPVLFPYFVGYSSHLLLDLLNKKGLQLFYPLKNKICFHLCYAGKTGNKVFLVLGIVISAGMIVYQVLQSWK